MFSVQQISQLPKWLKYELPLTLLFILPGLAFIQTTGDLSLYFRYQVPDGQILYLVSKLSGLYAIILLWLQLLQGLLSACGHQFLNQTGDPRFHRYFGLWVVCLFITHIATFIAAVSLRNGYFTVELLWPHFFGPYYPAVISLGLIAAYLLLMAVVIAIFGKRLPQKLWIWGHRLSWLAFFLVFLHSYLIGSETRVGLMEYLYYFMIIATVITIGYRLRKTRVVSIE
jgi:predicted ferric reductase